jgi:nucleotide-binding universal stress UspA family protein
MYKRMLVCVTASKTSREVVKVATKLCSRKTKVFVLHVVQQLSKYIENEVQREFSWAVELFKKERIPNRLEIVESTDVKRAIISTAKKRACDIIVIGTIPRKGVLGYFSESISDYVVKKAPCTVVLVRGAPKPR